MKKDWYDYILKPTANEIRKEKFVEKLFFNESLKIPEGNILNFINEDLLARSIINYKNSLLENKLYCATAFKYYKYLKKAYIKEEYEAYKFWSIIYIDLTLRGVSSIYDKSMHIINYMYNLKQKNGSGFNLKVLEQLKKAYPENYLKYNDIYKEYKTIKNNDIRNNSEHNASDFFEKAKVEEVEGGVSWKIIYPITIGEGIKKIEAVVDILEKHKLVIEKEIRKIYKSNSNK